MAAMKRTHLVYSTKRVARQQREQQQQQQHQREQQRQQQQSEQQQQHSRPNDAAAPPESSPPAVDTATAMESTSLATTPRPIPASSPGVSRHGSGSGERTRSSSSGQATHTHSHRSSRRSTRLGERSVKRLRPSPALLQSDRATVAQCVKMMVEKKTDATLLVDRNGLLTGILTDRDIAHKVVALEKSPKFTKVSEVMTPNPHCVASNASAIDALKKMVHGKFRHLPVADNEKVVGILDIAKCLYEAIAKIEREYKDSSTNLSEAIKKLEKHLPSEARENLFEKLREKLFLPTLSAILMERSPVPSLGPSATALEAAKLMLANKTNAVLVCNEDDAMIGIFTSKDLMRRVVALDLAPGQCLLASVMTPNPFTAKLNTTILETLHSMHNGRFLHVPVFDDDHKLVGLVDVLQATCAIVQQMATLQIPSNASVQPLWNQIRQSFIHTEDSQDNGDAEDDENEIPSTEEYDDGTDQSTSDLLSSDHRANWTTARDSGYHTPEHQDSETLEQPVQEKPPDVFVYKLADWNGANHRFTSSAESLKELLKDVQNRLGDYTIRKVHYVDDDGEHVLLFTDDDLKDAVNRARTWGNKYIRLIVLHRVSRSSVRSSSGHHNDNVLGIVYYAAAAAAIAGASFFLSRRR